MTDHSSHHNDPKGEGLRAVSALLNDPAMWAEPSPDVEDRVLAAILGDKAGTGLGSTAGPAEPITAPGSGVGRAGPQAPPGDAPTTGMAVAASPTGPIDLDAARSRRRPRRRVVVSLVAAAAVIVAALGALSFIQTPTDEANVAIVDLGATDYAPNAYAVARIEDRPNGTRILLDLDELPPAPEGMFYAVWLLTPEPRTRVGAGTFHMRGGPGEIELWAGVSTQSHPTVSVTLQNESDPDGPGELVLRGQLGG